MKNIISILLILASIGIIFGFLKPTWAEISALKQEETKYAEAIDQVESLTQKLQKDQAELSQIPEDDIARLNKLIPDNIDNVKLIIDINNIADSQGLSIRGINIDQEDPTTKKTSKSSTVSNSDYDSISLSFNVNATYPRFVEFLKALETSLRLVDITSVSFSPSESGTYNFAVTLKTYWLK